MSTKTKNKKYSFNGKIWKYKGKSGWYFITLPKSLSQKIRRNHGFDEEGWGRLKTLAKIGGSEWNTAIWYDSKIKSYLLPVKSLIRKSEQIEKNSKVAGILVLENSIKLTGKLKFKVT